MSQVRPTKITTITNDEAYDLAVHMARMADSAKVVIPVTTQAEEDGLPASFGGTLPNPTFICRTDQGMLIKKWNGTVWVTAPHVEFTYSVGAGAIPNNSLWGPGTLTLDTGTVTTDSSLASSPSADKLTIANIGTYMIWFGGSFGAGVSGNSWFQIRDSTDTTVHASGPAVEFWGHASIPNFRVTAANTVLWFRLKQVSGGATSGAGRVRVTRIG